MKKNFLSIAFCLIVVLGSSQSYFDSFNSVITEECETTGELINSIPNWEFFQTKDQSINGEKTQVCFDVYDTRIVSVENAIDESPIFFRNIENLDSEITSNYPYSFFFSINTSEDDFCNCNFDCVLPICYSAKIKLSAITGNDTVYYEKIITDPSIESNSIQFNNCFLTEKAEKTILNGIEITISKETYSPFEDLRISTISLFQFEGVDFENRVIPNEFKVNSAYFVSPFFFNPYQFGATLVRHLIPGVPGPQNTFYYDLIPEDSTSQQTINIVLGLDNNLLFQSYTGLRGAYVSEDQDSIRHNFNLINEGATICFFEIVEAIFSNDDNFIHKSGFLDFQSSSGCMQFRDRSKFIIKENSSLDYGKNGKGLLALQDQSQINFEPDSKMNFDGEIILKPSSNNKMSVILNEGSKFTFGPRSKISSKLNAEEIQLSIYLNGGILDTSKLDSESLEYLNIIDYNNAATNIRLLEFEMFPNPSSNQITLVNKSPQKVKFNIIDISGKVLQINYINSLSEQNIDVSQLDEGIYFVKSELGTQRKLVINR